MEEEKYFETGELDEFITFIKRIEWRDPWLLGLILFHVFVTLTTLLTRNHGNFQVVLFLVLLLLVYFSENINEIASKNWDLFSRQQYFDSKGVFISLVFSAPILLNCMVLVASWLYQSSQLMAKLKRAQLQAQHAKQKRANQTARNNENLNGLGKDKADELIFGVKNKILDATGIGYSHGKVD